MEWDFFLPLDNLLYSYFGTAMNSLTREKLQARQADWSERCQEFQIMEPSQKETQQRVAPAPLWSASLAQHNKDAEMEHWRGGLAPVTHRSKKDGLNMRLIRVLFYVVSSSQTANYPSRSGPACFTLMALIGLQRRLPIAASHFLLSVNNAPRHTSFIILCSWLKCALYSARVRIRTGEVEKTYACS